MIADKVLVVEADTTVHAMIKGYLANLGCNNVRVLTSGQEVMDLLVAEVFDLVILEWKLKSPSGVELFTEIKNLEQLNDMRLIAISGRFTPQDKALIKSRPGSTSLEKPFPQELFLEALGVTKKVKAKGNNTQESRTAAGKQGQQLLHIKGDKRTGPETSVEKGVGGGRLGLMIDQGSGRGANGHTVDQGQGQAGNGGFTQERSGQGGPELFTEKKAGIIGSGTYVDKASAQGRSDGTFVDKRAAGPSDGLFVDKKQGHLGNDRFVDKGKGESGDGRFAKEVRAVGVPEGEAEIFGKITVPSLDEDDRDAIISGVFSSGFQSDGSLSTLQNVLIIEKDSSLRQIMAAYLKERGVPFVTTVDTSAAAWKSIKELSYDLIILDWKFEDVSALALYNRLRMNQVTLRTAVIIVSGFPNREDFRIIEDNPATVVLQKPFQVKALFELIEKLRSTLAHYRKNIELVTKQLIKNDRDGKSIANTINDIKANFQNPALLLVTVGSFLYSQNHLKEAEEVFKQALKIQANNLRALTYLGKIYHRLNRTKEALDLLTTAQGLSPNNLERLCALGEIGITLKDHAKAKEHFEKALAIDKEDVVAQAGIILAKNLKTYIDQGLDHQPMGVTFASALNVVGITFVRSKLYEQGIEQYQAAMVFIEDPAVLARLQFNLGLAYLRARDFTNARAWFGKAGQNTGADFAKPGAFLQMIDKLEKEPHSKARQISLSEISGAFEEEIMLSAPRPLVYK